MGKVVPYNDMIKRKNLMLIDVQYANKRRNEDEQLNDCIYIIWRDLDTQEKCLTVVESPTVKIYFENADSRDFDYNKPWEYKSRLYSKVVKYRDIISAIASDEGESGKNRLSAIYESRDFKALSEFYRYPYSFGADYDPMFYYRYEWLKTMNNDSRKTLTKGFLDIEVDLVNTDGRFPEAKLHPIELVTLIDAQTKTSYTFILRQQPLIIRNTRGMREETIEKEKQRELDWAEKIKQQEALFNDIESFRQEIHDTFDETYPGIDYKLYLYSDEKKMIKDIFTVIRILNLDFIEIWNASFDIPYIIERATELGLNPVDLFSHPDFKNKLARFVTDHLHTEIKNNNDHFICTGYTNFVCQMRIYAQIRKGEPELRSLKLNDIGRDLLQDEKLDYGEEGNLKKFACYNYRKYVLYNIKDVLLQYAIENKTSDLDTYYSLSYLNCTPYADVFKQTAVLRNIQYMYFDKQGVIPGNNVNKLDFYKKAAYIKIREEMGEDVDEDEKAEGAVVGNPLLIDNFGIDLYGKKSSHCFRYSVDMDMSAFYPNTITCNNIEPTCLIFRVRCHVGVFDIRGGMHRWRGITDKTIAPPINGKRDEFYTEDAAKEIFDNLQTGNILSTGYKFLNMPGVDEIHATLLNRM